MKAIFHERYGRPDVLELREVDRPVIEDEQVLVRVHASSVNPVDWYGVTGLYFARIGSGLRRPKSTTIGADLAGRVEAVGSGVKLFKPGDEVFGNVGRFLGRVRARPRGPARAEAGQPVIRGSRSGPSGRDHRPPGPARQGQVQAGQKVLINGASGGVGTFAVQIAKAFGADVTAVCSTRNVEQARSLGADRVVDYTQEDFTKGGDRHDLMLDIAGSRSFLTCRRILTPEATVVLIGGPITYRGLGPLPHIAGTILKSRGRSQTVKFFVAEITTENLRPCRSSSRPESCDRSSTGRAS